MMHHVMFQYMHTLYNVQIKVNTPISSNMCPFFVVKTFQVPSFGFSENYIIVICSHPTVQ